MSASWLPLAALATTVKELRAQLRAGGLSEGQVALAAPGSTDGAEQAMSSREREDLAALLTAGEGDRRLIDAQARPAPAPPATAPLPRNNRTTWCPSPSGVRRCAAVMLGVVAGRRW